MPESSNQSKLPFEEDIDCEFPKEPSSQKDLGRSQTPKTSKCSQPLPEGSQKAIKAQIKVHLEELDEIHLKEVLLFCRCLEDREKF